jgi:hypothetical protein
MRQLKRLWQQMGFAAVSLAALAAAPTVGRQAPGQPAAPGVAAAPAGARNLDPSKIIAIESPTRTLVQALSTSTPPTRPPGLGLDQPKGAVIEAPTARVVKDRSAPALDGFVNPRVAPGLVRWHASLAEACARSSTSRKPVLLFQMMGKLDEALC